MAWVILQITVLYMAISPVKNLYKEFVKTANFICRDENEVKNICVYSLYAVFVRGHPQASYRLQQ
jgi:hypothetical protein